MKLTKYSMSDPILSIIIVSFNTKDLLKDCINSIYLTVKRPSYEVIVIDNDSADGSIEMLQNEFKEITLIKNKENLGFAKANNQAIKIAQGRYLLLLNSDTILKENTAEKLVCFMENNPKAAAVGPKVLNHDGTLQSKGFAFPSILFTLITTLNIPKHLSDEKLCRWLPKFYWGEDDIRQVDWISGCCMLLKREAIENIAGLSEDFFLFFEDEEWCYRAKQNGYQIWYYPAAAIIHHGGSSPLLNGPEIGQQSVEIFFKKTIGRLRGTIIALIYIFSFIIKLIRLRRNPHETNEYQNTKIRLGYALKSLKSILT